MNPAIDSSYPPVALFFGRGALLLACAIPLFFAGLLVAPDYFKGWDGIALLFLALFTSAVGGVVGLITWGVLRRRCEDTPPSAKLASLLGIVPLGFVVVFLFISTFG